MKNYAPIVGIWGFIVAVFFSHLPASRVYGLEESIQAGGSNAKAVHQLGQTAQGVNVGVVLARNARTTHEAFKDSNGVTHAFNLDYSGSGVLADWHDTRLAGIISSRGGISFPNDIGVAPGADIYCARVVDDACEIDWNELRNALDGLINTYNCRVIVTGFQLEINGDGSSIWTLAYDYFAYQNGVVFANAAGNNNTYITIFGDAYNGVTTGGLRLNNPVNEFDYRRVGSISGQGLTADGRRKPEITAPSQSQTVPNSASDTSWVTVGTTYGETSWAVPQTAGAAALLIGLADGTPGPNDNQSEVIKAVLVNSAMPNVNDKNNNFTDPADSNNTWQNHRGYGRLDALRAYQTLDTAEVEPGFTFTQDRGWGFGRLAQGQINQYTITIDKPCRLIATLTWQRRVEWVDIKRGIPPAYNGIIEPDELHPYLADLDMLVLSPGSITIFNETLFGLNPADNLEKCDLLILEPGDYTIRIVNGSTNGETADYGLAYELHPVLTGDLDVIDYTVDTQDLDTLVTDWLATDSALDELLSPDGIIDFYDFDKLARQWLVTDPLYYPAP